jgi:hypothetical protein
MQGFQGYGYDRYFVNNLAGILKEIDTNPDLELEIIAECDAICFKCPHNKEDVCKKDVDSEIKVKEMDEWVLRKLELQKGAVCGAGDIIELLHQKLENTTDIIEICGDCDWKKECLLFLSMGL